MSRISRTGGGRAGVDTGSADGKYRAALYIRLSREDGDKAESDSIVNQRKKLMDYIAGRDEFAFSCIYIDDGYSGVNFERPDFKRMLADIESRAVNCVIVKDLSRFGRDYIGVGEFLEKIFPENDIRFIAIDDNIDSLRGGYDMMMPVRNVFNEQYAADISKKVQSALRTKQRSGEFIGAFAPYGYQKDPKNRNRLIIDPYAASIVRRIFNMYLAGMGKLSIAKQLNSEGVPCPGAYKSMSGLNYTNGRNVNGTNYWTYATIHRLLNHEVYIGSMVQGTNRRANIKLRKKKLPKEQWIKVAKTHEPIIEEAAWDAAQALLKRDTRQIDFNQNVSVFAGFLRCGDCGRAMVKNTYKRADGARSISYRCGSYQRYGSAICSPHTVRHEVLEKIILRDINAMISNFKDFREVVASELRAGAKKLPNAEREIERLNTARERTKRLRLGLYEDYREGVLNLDEYRSLKLRYDEEEQMYENVLNSLTELEEGETIPQRRVRHLLEREAIEETDRDLLAELVDEIRIFEESRIKVTYRIEKP